MRFPVTGPHNSLDLSISDSVMAGFPVQGAHATLPFSIPPSQEKRNRISSCHAPQCTCSLAAELNSAKLRIAARRSPIILDRAEKNGVASASLSWKFAQSTPRLWLESCFTDFPPCQSPSEVEESPIREITYTYLRLRLYSVL